jgi:uncharacterized membrane protein YjgN (DUF898 family)
MPKHQANKDRFSWAKLFIALALCICLGILVWTGSMLFLKHQISPILGAVVFLAQIALFVWLIYLLRSSRYRWRTPSFIVVFFSLLLIIVVTAFAGVQPLSTYKDNIVKGVTTLAQTASQCLASIQIKPTIAPVATVESIHGPGPFIHGPGPLDVSIWADGLWVEIKPTSLAKADYAYKVDLRSCQ